MATSANNMDKYDRQNRTFGKEATIALNSSIVYIFGLEGGLGSEVAKNLVLSGAKDIFLIDDNNVTTQDVDFGYYYNTDNIGKKRSCVLKTHIQELNPYSNVNSIDYTTKFCPYSCIIVCNKTMKEAININNITREQNCKMVYAFAKGLAGYVFVDALDNHIVNDLDGENIQPVEVRELLDDGKVTCDKHKFQHNSLIEFCNLKGDNLDFLVGTKFRITDVTAHSFKLKDFTHKDFHFINGTINLVREPVKFNHTSLADQFKKVNYDIVGFNPIEDQKIIDTFKSVDHLKDEYIHPWSSIMDDLVSNFIDDYQPIVRTIGIELAPVNSIIGGFASTEVIKLLTYKYTPITQFFTWSDFSLLPKSKPVCGTTFGKEFYTKLSNVNALMVGCGALGCEWLKNLSLLNVGINGNITITDPDHIETSNLSRQFLFRSHHVGKSKSQMAVRTIESANPNMKLTPLQNKLSKEDKDLTDRLFSDRNIIINALDNMEARKYVDSQCFERNLPLFESGTMGMKANTQPVIPFVTETYSDSNDPDAEDEFPICTIKNFPNSTQHTIHWARDYFELFNRGITNVNKYFENPTFYEELSLFEKNQAIQDINLFLGKYNLTIFEECLEFAKDIFIKEYNHTIKQLLHCFPSDHVVNGSLFWSQGKRCPKPLNFTGDCDENIVNFIDATVKIISRCFDNKWEFTQEQIIDYLKSTTIPDFNPDSSKKIAKDDSELKEIKETTTDVEISKTIKLEHHKCFPQEFEKDDDSNYHVYWLTSASNCRALNYSINTISEYETKGIAGKIIPAVATTTATTVGLIFMEMLKYLQDSKLEDYRTFYMNMADNTSIFSEPIEMKKIELGDKKINGWTKFEYKKDTSLKIFKEYFETNFNVNIDMIIQDTRIIFSEFMPDTVDVNESLSKIFTDRDIKHKGIPVNLLISTTDEVDFPPIQVTL